MSSSAIGIASLCRGRFTRTAERFPKSTGSDGNILNFISDSNASVTASLVPKLGQHLHLKSNDTNDILHFYTKSHIKFRPNACQKEPVVFILLQPLWVAYQTWKVSALGGHHFIMI